MFFTEIHPQWSPRPSDPPATTTTACPAELLPGTGAQQVV